MWHRVSNRDPRVIALYNRQYSAARGRKAGRYRGGIAGNGESITLLTGDGRAVFNWIRQDSRRDGQIGVNCSVFRNEGPALSSELIRAACALAWQRWPGERLWTYVDGDATARRRGRAHPPGCCFIMAGWTLLPERSRRGLYILECWP